MKNVQIFDRKCRKQCYFSVQAQDMLADAVHMAFKQLVIALQSELELVLPALLSERLVALSLCPCLSL